MTDPTQPTPSPKERTEKTFVRVMRTIRPRARSHSGAPTHSRRIVAPATASKPTTMTQKYQ